MDSIENILKTFKKIDNKKPLDQLDVLKEKDASYFIKYSGDEQLYDAYKGPKTNFSKDLKIRNTNCTVNDVNYVINFLIKDSKQDEAKNLLIVPFYDNEKIKYTIYYGPKS